MQVKYIGTKVSPFYPINTQLITAIGICPFLLLSCADFESKSKNIGQIYRRETVASGKHMGVTYHSLFYES